MVEAAGADFQVVGEADHDGDLVAVLHAVLEELYGKFAELVFLHVNGGELGIHELGEIDVVVACDGDVFGDADVVEAQGADDADGAQRFKEACN